MHAWVAFYNRLISFSNTYKCALGTQTEIACKSIPLLKGTFPTKKQRVINKTVSNVLAATTRFIVHNHRHIQHSTMHQPYINYKRGYSQWELRRLFTYYSRMRSSSALFTPETAFQGFLDVLASNDSTETHDSLPSNAVEYAYRLSLLLRIWKVPGFNLHPNSNFRFPWFPEWL